MREPELIIGYEGSGIPMSAACSLCGEFMPDKSPGRPSSNETIAQFSEDFKIHIGLKHEHRFIN